MWLLLIIKWKLGSLHSCLCRDYLLRCWCSSRLALFRRGRSKQDSRPDLRPLPIKLARFGSKQSDFRHQSNIGVGTARWKRRLCWRLISNYLALSQLSPRFKSCPRLRFRAKLRYWSGSARCLWWSWMLFPDHYLNPVASIEPSSARPLSWLWTRCTSCESIGRLIELSAKSGRSADNLRCWPGASRCSWSEQFRSRSNSGRSRT